MIGYFTVNYFIEALLKSIRNLFSHQQNILLKIYFPYKYISQEEYISHLEQMSKLLARIELDFKNLDDITLIKREDFKLSNNKTMIRYELLHVLQGL